jgi:NAD(P)-dependent dehydrogenase (short-subunit alcohol dehydrogenase family)
MGEPAASTQRALITGAGSGLGLALARRYARAGYAIAVADLDAARADAAVAELAAIGPGHFAVTVDVADAASVEAMRDRVAGHWPDGFDVLINNAGVATAGSVADSPLEDWHWVIGINLMGVVHGMKAFAPMFQRRQRGHVISTASFAALAGAPGIASYGTTKAAVVALSEGLRAEMRPHGVKVSVICPSFFKTNLLDSARGPDQRFKAFVGGLMERAKETADDIADYVFRAAGRGDFMIIPTGPERLRWRLKRFLPNYYFAQMVKMLGRSTAAAK